MFRVVFIRCDSGVNEMKIVNEETHKEDSGLEITATVPLLDGFDPKRVIGSVTINKVYADYLIQEAKKSQWEGPDKIIGYTIRLCDGVENIESLSIINKPASNG